MLMQVYKKISLRISILFLIIALFIAIAVWASTRPLERIASIQTSDGKHIHQVYKGHMLRTDFIATAQGLSGIALEIVPGREIPNIRLFNTTDAQEIPTSLQQQNNTLHIVFAPQDQSYGKHFSLSIDAPNTPKQSAVFIPYESDATKYPNNIVWQGTVKKQGSLGITQYEKPTIALLVARWLALPHQRPLWVGIALCIAGFALRRTPSRSPLYKGEKSISSPHPPAGGEGGGVGSWIYYIVVFLSIIAIYWHATQLFFYSDDVPILARTAYMAQHQPFLLFTPHQYQDADPRAAFGFDFWRPVSFALYPFFLHLILPPSAWIYYFINISLFACIGCLLFSIANTIFQSKPAALVAVALWATNSSKLGVVYWWSSVQDILASLFAMTAIVLYIQFRSKGKHIFLYLSSAAYLLGMFSKEYVIVTPIAIAGLEIFIFIQHGETISWKNTMRRLHPFIIAAGAFLILNTAVLGDPTLPPRKHTDQTYSLTFSPHAIFRNTIIYLSATAEAKVWPSIQAIEDTLHQRLRLWEVKTSGPYYPGVALLIIGIALPLLLRKQKKLAAILLFGVGWWILFMGPILLLAHDWKLRWLMLATFGTGILAAGFLQQIFKKIPAMLFLCSALLFMYGYQNARSEELTRFYREQSEYTKEAYNQLTAQEKTISEEKRIIIIGITPDQETSLNAYLFRLYAKNPQADIIYVDSQEDLPREPAYRQAGLEERSGDIIINMTGITPYYPDSEK